MTREEQVTRASLLWRLKSDDDEVREIAWQEFHNCYAPTIRRFAFRLGATEEQAADVAQEVMLGFFSATPEFVYTPSRGRFRGYLKVCVCRALQRHRRRFVVATLPDEKLDDASAETGKKWTRHSKRTSKRRKSRRRRTADHRTANPCTASLVPAS